MRRYERCSTPGTMPEIVARRSTCVGAEGGVAHPLLNAPFAGREPTSEAARPMTGQSPGRSYEMRAFPKRAGVTGVGVLQVVAVVIAFIVLVAFVVVVAATSVPGGQVGDSLIGFGMSWREYAHVM